MSAMSHTTDFIATIEQRLAALDQSEAALDQHELRRWVVLSFSEQPLAFDIDGDHVDNPRGVQIERATRLNRLAARHVASRCKDGNGQEAKAVEVRHAYAVIRRSLRETLDVLKRHSEQQP